MTVVSVSARVLVCVHACFGACTCTQTIVAPAIAQSPAGSLLHLTDVYPPERKMRASNRARYRSGILIGTELVTFDYWRLARLRF